jgi:hypothetical protein
MPGQDPFPPRHLPYLNKLLGGGEAAHAERHEDPAPGIAALGGIVGELLADLAIDLIPGGGDVTSEGYLSPSLPATGDTQQAVPSHLPEAVQEAAEGLGGEGSGQVPGTKDQGLTSQMDCQA